MPVFQAGVFQPIVFQFESPTQYFYRPAIISNPHTGPMALRVQGWQKRTWRTPYGGLRPDTGRVQTGDWTPVPQRPSNRHTGAMAWRRSQYFRRQWIPPWGGAGTVATNNRMRVTQSVVEVLDQADDPPIFVTQSVVEVLDQADDPPIRVTQLVIEVLRKSAPEGGNQIIIVGM